MKELPIQPSGLFWQDDFITPEHEEELIRIFRHELVWPAQSGRSSLHYGYTFDYKTFGVDPDVPFKPFPDWLRPLIPTREGTPPAQVCLQYYPPGAGIPPHVDTHSAYDQLYALSLGAPVMMQFSKPGGEGRMVEVDLAPRSMLQMAGEARLHWKHGIRKRKTDTLADGTVRKRGDRWSITYRWIREPAVCGCGDVSLCDTAQRELGIEREYRWKKGDGADGDQKEENGDS
ncbi:Alkylated DNA repair protein alkB-like protein 8 [Colletotrichum chlorophyti]|uniref:Alkylated DNA repair protein alkB-like protein 8 n=1 Tax=Colletotrichum chlorophyti TaxID=708187 RepID=A0A1Q8S6J0_9PEZI|nr:Alkylated DNA repair protein alkB-like protein 8 [Colletotrichum chlorophyti]